MSTYLDKLREAGRIKPCPQCGETDVRPVIFDPGHQHYGRFYGVIVCNHCPGTYDGNQRIDWAPKPENLAGRPKRPQRSTGLLSAIRADRDGEPLYCEVCLVDERALPTGTWLEAHHIIEHQDGGTDHPQNLQALCNTCHELVHWRRRDRRNIGIEQATKQELAHAPG